MTSHRQPFAPDSPPGRRPKSPVSWLLIGLVAVFAFHPFAAADDPVSADRETTATIGKEWTVLWDARRSAPGKRPLEEDSPLQPLKEFQIEGVPDADPFWLSNFRSEGTWGSANRRLTRIAGKNAALKLARAESFELQGVLNAEGLGGWFLLFGWDKGHGYGLYNVTLKTSGSPWIFTEFRDSAAIAETHREKHRYLWKGEQPMFVVIIDKKLTVQVGRETILKDFELPNYHAGDVILGTYDTPYGPKPVSVRSLRIRAK